MTLLGVCRILFIVETVLAACSYKAGYCPFPIPKVPSGGLRVTYCKDDSECATNFKCCPITQKSSGKIYLVCTAPLATLINPSKPDEGVTDDPDIETTTKYKTITKTETETTTSIKTTTRTSISTSMSTLTTTKTLPPVTETETVFEVEATTVTAPPKTLTTTSVKTTTTTVTSNITVTVTPTPTVTKRAIEEMQMTEWTQIM